MGVTPVTLLDTHVWAWSMLVHPKMSQTARRLLDEKGEFAISAVSVFEIGQKVRLGKWPEMRAFAGNLLAYAERQRILVASVTIEIADLAGRLDWPHRDPFDRMLAATALVNGWPLISADPAFDSLIGLRRVW